MSYAALRADLRLELRTASIDVESAVLEWRMRTAALAQAFAESAASAGRIGGVDVRTIHIVGGGALNELLCQRTADRAGLPVLAGPVEATALGNVLVQARAAGLVTGSLEALRDLVARTHAPRRYEPRA